jgi:glycosyltransferase involved in cell wall biosynthesis
MADRGMAFDGLSPRERPLGGAESAFVALAEALAAQGCAVEARTVGAREMMHEGVRWAPIETKWPQRSDLYIANRDPSLIGAHASAGTVAFWLHNPAQFLSKPRYAWPIMRKKPKLVFLGPSHESTAPRWIKGGGRVQIGHGVEAPFLETPRAPGTPAPRALFVSNPMRGLDRLITLWRTHIQPHVPSAELHVFSGAQTYDGAKAKQMAAALRGAQAAASDGVVLRSPVPKAALAGELADARALLYLGDPGETFCLAVAEAQAMGVPAVVKPIGAVGERVTHGETGFVETDDARFCERAVVLLTDDALWARQSAAALATRPQLGWARAARDFMQLADG